MCILYNYLYMLDRNHVPSNCCAAMCDSDEKANDQKYMYTYIPGHAKKTMLERTRLKTFMLQIFNLQKCREHRDTKWYLIFAVARLECTLF